MRSVGAATCFVLLLLVIPLLAMLLFAAPPFGGIEIDGKFADWARLPQYTDSTGDSSPALDLAEYRVLPAEDLLLVYAKVAQNLWSVPEGHTESLYTFVDGDGDAGTGFKVGGIGAEEAAEFYGWDGMLKGSQAWEYDPLQAPSSDDWRSLRPVGGVDVASAQNQVEARIVPGPSYDFDRARFLFHTWSTLGTGDAADAVISRATGALVISQRTIAADVVSTTLEPFLAFTIRPLPASIGVASVTIREYGSLPPSAAIGSLFLDRAGDGVIDGGDPLLATAPFAPEGRFWINRTLASAESYVLRIEFMAAPANASVGFQVVSASTAAGAEVPVSLSDTAVSMAYIAGAPTDVTIDGAFADWSRYAVRIDPNDDVQSVSSALNVNENIDIRASEAIVDANVSLYIGVDGRLFGGANIPNLRGRVAPPPSIDSDGDTVPDSVEQALGPTLPVDFNNDNISDGDQFEDVDQDGSLEYNKCSSPDCSVFTDYVLETTIPVWYPSAYGGKTIRRYVGPVSLPSQRGVDTAVAYLDRDNRTDTGLPFHTEGVSYGMDYAYQAVGGGGAILAAGLYAHNESREIPWEKVADVPTAIDARQLEAGFDAALVNLTSNHTFVFVTTDWRSNSDTADLGSAVSRAPRPGTRSGSGDGGPPRLFDISGNARFYLRSTDHATEAACTADKVASATQGGGPAAVITLAAGQSVCWYADATAGTTIPAGDWEALIDILTAHGVAAYGEIGATSARYREWDGSFSAEGSASAVGGLEQWVVVAASPLTPEMLVAVLSSNNQLYVMTWDGAAWTANWNTAIGGSATRRFDVGYEGVSGDALVVFGDGTSQLKFRRRLGGTWDGSNQNAGTPLSSYPRHVRLAPRPVNDDLFVGVGTNSNGLHALRWDGAANSMGDQVQMSVGVSQNTMEAFDIAFERASGDAFVIWGTAAATLSYREFAGAWQAETTAYVLPYNALWVVADSNPIQTSSDIAVGITLTTNNNFEFGAWDGTQWVVRPPGVVARNPIHRGIDVAFESSTGRAVYAFNQNANPMELAWRTWSSSSGFSSVSVLPGATADLRFVQLRSNPYRDEIMALYHDTNNDLFRRHWSGSAWSSLGGALETSLSAGAQREPFMFAWTRAVEYDVHLEIWNLTSNTIRETIGSCLDRRGYGDDVQCLVSGVPLKVIGPSEVVRLRVVHSSVGGTILIQFDDIASGGDSRVTLPVTIPEFETLIVPLAMPFVLYVAQRARRRKKG